MLLYDITLKLTVDRLKTYWMPRISKITERAHVIVIGVKLDLEAREKRWNLQNSGHMWKSSNFISSISPIYEYQVEIGLEFKDVENRI